MKCKHATLYRLHSESFEDLAIIDVADNPLARARGLLGRTLAERQGLLISPCSSIHTFGMGYSLDVVFLDASKRIKKICRNISPWRIAWCMRAKYVLEFNAGFVKQLGLSCGQELKWVPK